MEKKKCLEIAVVPALASLNTEFELHCSYFIQNQFAVGDNCLLI